MSRPQQFVVSLHSADILFVKSFRSFIIITPVVIVTSILFTYWAPFISVSKPLLLLILLILFVAGVCARLSLQRWHQLCTQVWRRAGYGPSSRHMSLICRRPLRRIVTSLNTGTAAVAKSLSASRERCCRNAATLLIHDTSLFSAYVVTISRPNEIPRLFPDLYWGQTEIRWYTVKCYGRQTFTLH